MLFDACQETPQVWGLILTSIHYVLHPYVWQSKWILSDICRGPLEKLLATLALHFFLSLKKSFKSFTSRFVFFLCVFVLETFNVLFYLRILSNEMLFTQVFREKGTFNINSEIRNVNKKYLLFRLAKRWLVCLCTKPRQPALNENFNLIRGSWLDVSLLSHLGKAIRDIWLVYIGFRMKIYFAAFQCVNLSTYIIKL